MGILPINRQTECSVGKRKIISIVNTEQNTPITSSGHFNSAFALASAESRNGDDVTIWASVPEHSIQIHHLSSKYNIVAHSVNKYLVVLKLLAINIFPWITRPDFIRVHSGMPMVSKKARSLKRLSGKSPLIWFLHGPHQTKNDFFSNQEQLHVHLKNVESINSLAVPSQAEKEAQVKIGVPESKIHVVPNIVKLHAAEKLPTEILNIPPEKKLLLFGARIEQEKGLTELIDAFEILIQNDDNVILAVAGKGKELDNCRKKASTMINKVYFLGYQNNLTALLHRADLFIAPSKAESFGRTAIEAAMSQTPMLISRIKPWTDFYTEGKHCLFINPEDSRETANKIKLLLDNESLAKKLAISARKHTDTIFGEDATLSAIHQLYQITLALYTT